MEARETLRADGIFTPPPPGSDILLTVSMGAGGNGPTNRRRRPQEVLPSGWTKTGIDTQRAGQRSETCRQMTARCSNRSMSRCGKYKRASQLENIGLYSSKGNVYLFGLKMGLSARSRVTNFMSVTSWTLTCNLQRALRGRGSASEAAGQRPLTAGAWTERERADWGTGAAWSGCFLRWRTCTTTRQPKIDYSQASFPTETYLTCTFKAAQLAVRPARVVVDSSNNNNNYIPTLTII